MIEELWRKLDEYNEFNKDLELIKKNQTEIKCNN